MDIDHLILNIVNTFQEKHFSVETPKLFGQIYVLLSTNPNQYSIEVHLQQIQIKPVNIIDLNEVGKCFLFSLRRRRFIDDFQALSIDEKKNMTRLLDDTIKRTVVRCSFRLSDQQENTNPITSPTKASIGSPPDTTKIVRQMRNFFGLNEICSSILHQYKPMSQHHVKHRRISIIILNHFRPW